MRFLLFADIHIGSIKDTNYVYNTLINIIDKEVIFTKTDAVFILGDYFDRLFKVNEEFVSVAINVMAYLYRACKKNKTKIRIIYGTESHEMNQYKLFNYYLTSKAVDMKLITTCTEEEIFPNVNILYVPEEYISDKHEFYHDYLYAGKKYNYIFGHGVIVEGMPKAVSYTTTMTNEKQVPHFKAGELSSISDICIFGHYHCYTDMGDNVYYLGSLFRDSFGEETPKGYGIIEDNKFTFIENDKAYIYKTYEINSDSNAFNSADDIMNEIKKIKEENPNVFNGEQNGKIRIIFHTPENVDPSFRENLKSILFNDKLITPLIKEENNEVINDAKESVDEEDGFILDGSLPINDKIYQFIIKQYDDPMTLEELTKYIDNPLEI